MTVTMIWLFHIDRLTSHTEAVSQSKVTRLFLHPGAAGVLFEEEATNAKIHFERRSVITCSQAWPVGWTLKIQQISKTDQTD